jgi:TRAP-type C4-dicarboxylate transport system permease small subunit
MNRLSELTRAVSKRMSIVAGASLMGVMLLTVCDVTLRYFGYPIMGVYDLVAIGGAVVVGFSIPYAADNKVHIYMEMADFVIRGAAVKTFLYCLTRLIATILTLVIAYNLVKLGINFRKNGEASLTIQLAYYPISYGLAACFALQAFVYLAQIVESVMRKGHE